MAFNPLKEKGMPLDKQVRNWESLVGQPYSKEEVHPYTRARIILMNGIEVEAAIFLHEFNRMEKRPEVKEQLAMTRRIEQQQQKAVNGLIPGNESILENTIGYEQVAVDLTAFLARTVTDPYVKQVFDFGLLEDFDHLYRYSNLMETLEGKQAEKIVQDLTEIIPGRPTIVEHRHPFDSLRKPADRKKADPRDMLYIMTLVAGEQQTMNFYMNMANRLEDHVGRGLYTEIGMIEEQHVSQYESLLDPRMNWFQMMVCHDYNECYLYHSFMEQETDPRVKKMWELHLDMELGHLRAAVQLMKKYDKNDPSEILPKHLPEPVVFQSNVAYVRDVLESQLNLTAVGTEFRPIDQVDPGFRYFEYQKMVNGAWVPSQAVIAEHTQKRGGDYRLELTNGERAGKIRPAGYYAQFGSYRQTVTNDIFSLLHKDHEEAKALFAKLDAGQKDKGIFEELEQELSVHMEVEEKLFYQRLKEIGETRKLTLEGYDEHNEAKGMMKEVESIPFGREEWQSKFQQLQQAIEHHIEEEEQQLFEKARHVLDREEAQRMAGAYQQEKEKRTKKAG